MQVLSSGVPMTCGEVYALVRRRRDERSATCQPPFGLQLTQADVQGCASSRYVVARNNNNSSTSNNSGAAPSSASSQAALLAMTGESSLAVRLAQSGNVHLLVLLCEVQLLQYLRKHARLSAAEDADVSHVYGPSSAYTAIGDDDDNDDNAEQQQQHTTHDTPAAAATAMTSNADERQLQRRVRASPPGTTAHVRAVRQLLSAYEQHGHAQQLRSVAALRALLANMSPSDRHTATTTRCNAHASAVKREAVDDDDNDEGGGGSGGSRRVARQHTHAHYGSDKVDDANNTTTATSQQQQQQQQRRQLRPLLSLPTPLTSSTDAAAVTHNATTSSSPSCSFALTDLELLRLVDAQPRCALDVHRLLDDLHGRLDGDEATVARVVHDIAAIFDSSSSTREAAMTGDKDAEEGTEA